MRVIAWRVWYVGGASFCSDTVRYEDLPDDGVLGVKVLFDVVNERTGERRFRIDDGREYYWRAPAGAGEWIFGYTMPYDDPEEVPLRYPGVVMLRGKWTTEAEMNRVVAEMQAWTVP